MFMQSNRIENSADLAVRFSVNVRQFRQGPPMSTQSHPVTLRSPAYASGIKSNGHQPE
jgi:hypothetical protein